MVSWSLFERGIFNLRMEEMNYFQIVFSEFLKPVCKEGRGHEILGEEGLEGVFIEIFCYTAIGQVL